MILPRKQMEPWELWVDVIAWAVSEARQGSWSARQWLTANNADFRKVCDLAQIDPEWARQQVSKAMGGI